MVVSYPIFSANMQSYRKVQPEKDSFAALPSFESFHLDFRRGEVALKLGTAPGWRATKLVGLSM